jgi:hypothetical protein
MSVASGRRSSVCDAVAIVYLFDACVGLKLENRERDERGRGIKFK